MLYIYLISQSQRRSYDTYDSCVVCARSEDEARLISPCGGELQSQSYDWVSASEVRDNPGVVDVKLLGTAAKGFKANSVLCASFNAG